MEAASAEPTVGLPWTAAVVAAGAGTAEAAMEAARAGRVVGGPRLE